MPCPPVPGIARRIDSVAASDETSCWPNAAFGDDPGRWPLPAGDDAARAVAARRRRRRSGPLRQRLGRPRSRLPSCSAAARWCRWRTAPVRRSCVSSAGTTGPAAGTAGRSALAGRDPEAGADALIGLAADALGVGRFAASAAALRRAASLLDGPAPPRLPVRLAWVSAELAMARGDGATAVGHAERAVELAAALGSARHTVKSDVVLAAALCSAGELDRSRRSADAALDDAERLGIIPLRWALACLLADIGSGALTRQQIV